MYENIFERLKPYYFTFEYWRAGSLAEFGIKTRTWFIEQNRFTIKKYAIGYIEGESLWIRPKKDTMAVMFFYKGEHFWTHLTKEEFDICFTKYEI